MEDTQIEQNFIGHEREIEIFKQWLTATDPDAPWILFFYDALDEPEQKGGVGKTWLLRKCAMLAQKLRKDIAIATIDFFSVADRNSIVIAQRVVESLQAAYPQWFPSSFLKILAEYQEAVGTNKEIPNIGESLHDALVVDLEALDQLLDTDGKHLLIFFDTFEVIEQHPLIAVVGTSHSHTFPDNYHFKRVGAVIAGRNVPNWTHQNWVKREQEVMSVPVEPFNPSEMMQFLINNCTTLMPLDMQPWQVTTLHQRTQGRPILIGLAVDVLNYRISTLDELLNASPENFEEYLVTQINRLEHPINWAILFMAHVYHRFNPTILHWIFEHSIDIKELIQDIDLEVLEQKLLKLSFVRISGSSDNLALHDEMRRLVNLYNWNILEQPTKGLRRELSKIIISYYEQEITSQADQQLRQSYIVEMLYHKLFIQSDDSFTFFREHFDRAIKLWQSAFARILLGEIKQHASALLLEEQRDNLLLAEASLLRREENHIEAISLYTQLEQQAEQSWLATYRTWILFEKAGCYQRMSKFPEAIDAFNQCLALAQADNNQSLLATTLGSLGYIHQRRGELDKAIDYHDRSIKIYKERNDSRGYADILTAMSTIYRLQGKLEEALRLCTVAWRIRQDLYERGLASEIGVGISLSRMGAAYFKLGDLVGAQKAFQKAHDIYVRNNYRTGIAEVYNRLGQIAMAGHELQIAAAWFDKAYNAALGIHSEPEINSLNKQGWIYVLQNQFTQAIPFLEKAILRAREVHDDYQQAESLIDLAATYARMGRYDDVLPLLTEAETITSEYNYYYLWGLIELERGDIASLLQKREEAFRHFAKSCYYMALYNPVEYEKAVRDIVSKLLVLPYSQISTVLQDLLTYWQTLPLGEKASPLIDALEEVQQLLGL
jgi:tetratricopeptide (TPR) repeat protein